MASCHIKFSSKGLANLASTTVILIPFFFKFSAAFKHSFSLAPKLKIANFLPSKIIFPLPIYNFSSIDGNSIPMPVPLGYLKAVGLSLMSTDVLIILTSSASSLAPSTTKFGKVDK